MDRARQIVVGFVILGGFLLLPGCGGGGKDGGGSAATDPATEADLKVIGLGFHNFNDSFRRGPRDADELKPVIQDAGPSAYQGLKDGRIVFIWNVALLDMQPPSDTILAYQKDVPTQGGPVLFGDASVRNLTAAEFKAAKLAKPKSK